MRAGMKRLPWVLEAEKDCHRLREHGALPADFPNFLDEPGAWQSLMQSAGTWKGLIDELFFVESVTDRCVEACTPASSGRALAYTCSRCTKAFASQMALQAHCRAKHGDRLDIRRYVRNSTCPACGTDYRDRLRCIAHLSDRRRPRCAEWVRINVSPMSGSEVSAFDAIDRQLRREAWRKGHTHHIAKLPALRPNGQVVGKIAG